VNTPATGILNGNNVFGSTLIGPSLNYCFLYANSNIPVVSALVTQLNNLATQFVKSMTAGASGSGTLSQILSSITGTLDVIMIGFLGSGVIGFLVLILYTQKVIIGIIT